jgi:GT2 family glycosyltransferase
VDNASTDGTKDYIKDLIDDKKVMYVNTGENLGGAGGFNFGMKEAYKIGCDYIWLMDDDCIVKQDSLTQLLEADEKLNGKYGFLSSKVLWKDNSLCVMNKQKQSFGTWFKDFDSDISPIAMASFVSFFVKKEIVEEVGLPIKEFFIWTDDWEYSRRISRKYKCYYVGKSVVIHKCKNNIGASIATVDEDRLDRFKYMYRNDVVLYRREGINGWILLYIRLMIHKIRILRSDKKDKHTRIQIINDAIKEGKNFYPEIEYVGAKDEK